MSDGSIVIKLFRNGLGKGPEYSITIHDSGKISYEGFNNVKIKDKIETSIDEEKIVSILEKLKDSGVFTINQKYEIDKTSNRPFTKLVVEMPGEDGSVKTKSIVHYDDDPMIPNSLKSFEDKIDEAVESYKWVKVPKEEEKIEKKPVEPPKEIEKHVKEISKKSNTGNKKIFKFVIPAAVAIIVVIGLVLFMLPNIGNEPNDDDTQKEVYDPPQILSLASAEEIIHSTPTLSSSFGINDPIYIYFEYSNVTHNSTYDFSGSVKLYFGQNLIDTYSFEVNSSQEFENYHMFLSNDSWSIGEYRVTFDLTDEISGLSENMETSFTLYDKIPKIIRFTPASSVNAYQDYTAKSVFDLGDTVYVYVEYSGINTTNDNTECNILLEINITDSSGKIYWEYSENKSTIGNNAHYWTVNTNSSWTSSVYNINFYLYDYNTGLSVKDSKLLIINS